LKIGSEIPEIVFFRNTRRDGIHFQYVFLAKEIFYTLPGHLGDQAYVPAFFFFFITLEPRVE
jgi:hypothetical protein